MPLLYRPDLDPARARLTAWWNGGDIGRPAFLLTAPREQPWEEFGELPRPLGWLTDYSTTSLPYRVHLALQRCLRTQYLAEAVPEVSPDLAPNCLALYLGCQGVEERDTVWCRPFLENPEEDSFGFDPRNPYWQFSTRLGREIRRLGRDRFLVSFPDLIEGLDTLAAMRGTERLLMDLVERPAWVHHCLRRITDLYFRYYDVLYDLIRDEVGGSVFWAWAPGRMAKFQCDFSAMISPGMFREFMVPVLKEMTERVSYSMYHWDGPGALLHLDAILSVPSLTMVQWTPGAGVDLPDHPRWWPFYHRILEGRKKVYVHTCTSVESLLAMKKEFGEGLKQFLIGVRTGDPGEAQRFLDGSTF